MEQDHLGNGEVLLIGEIYIGDQVCLHHHTYIQTSDAESLQMNAVKEVSMKLV